MPLQGVLSHKPLEARAREAKIDQNCVSQKLKTAYHRLKPATECHQMSLITLTFSSCCHTNWVPLKLWNVWNFYSHGRNGGDLISDVLSLWLKYSYINLSMINVYF